MAAREEAKWEAWKTSFSRYYENKLENPYEIAEYIAKMIQEGKDENLVDFCRTLTLMQLQPLALTEMILPLMHDRNLADFLYTWNLEFLICGMNYLITQENFVPVKTCLEALPTVPKVSNEISNSPLLENALKKYLELENFDIPLAEIITYLFAHKDVSTEERKLLIRLRRHVNAMVAPEENKQLFLTVLVFFSTDDKSEKVMKKANKEMREMIRSSHRTDVAAECFGVECAVSMNTKAKYCARCYYASYCSQKCQKAHWKLHKKHCSMLFKIGKNLKPIMAEMVAMLKENC